MFKKYREGYVSLGMSRAPVVNQPISVDYYSKGPAHVSAHGACAVPVEDYLDRVDRRAASARAL